MTEQWGPGQERATLNPGSIVDLNFKEATPRFGISGLGFRV